jgi:hypothetical protein
MRVKIGAVALVIGFAVLAAAVAVFVNDRLPERYAARGVMVATPKQPPAGAASPQLVETYANVIKTDPSVLRSLAESADMSRSEAKDALRVRALKDSLLVRISVTASSAKESKDGLDAVTEGFRSGRASTVLDPENIRLLERSPTESVVGGYRSTRSALITTMTAGADGDPTGPSRMAADYAGVIPEDDGLLAVAGRTVGKTHEQIRRNLTVRADSNTSVMRFSLTDSSYQDARRTLVALMRRLRDKGGGAGRIDPGAVRVVHWPDRAGPATRSALPAGIIGGVVGACVGAMVALGLTRRRRIQRTAA